MRECLRNWKQCFPPEQGLAGRVDCGVGVERQGESQHSPFVPHAACTLLVPMRKPWPRMVLR